jgi:hypothetical protein
MTEMQTLTIVSSFAGPALYRELSTTCIYARETLTKDMLLRSLYVAGWDSRMMQMEKLWRKEPGLAVLRRGKSNFLYWVVVTPFSC